MLYLELEIPVILTKQITNIANELKIDREDVKSVILYGKHVSLVEKGDVKKYDIISEKVKIDNDISDQETLIGSEAIIYLCDERNIDCPYIDTIDINRDIFYETRYEQWNDICFLLARIENRNERIQKLGDMKAPEVIMRNEKRMLTECLNSFENNHWSVEPVRYSDGCVPCSLKEIGYSLLTGWSEEKKKEFAELERAAERDWALQMEETEEIDEE